MEAQAKCEAARSRRTGDMSRIDRNRIQSQVRLRRHRNQEEESWHQQNSKSRLEAFEHTLLPRNGFDKRPETGIQAGHHDRRSSLQETRNFGTGVPGGVSPPTSHNPASRRSNGQTAPRPGHLVS
jgi:hypothetical protein